MSNVLMLSKCVCVCWAGGGDGGEGAEKYMKVTLTI